MASLDPDGGFAKRHLINPAVFRLLGDVNGRHIRDAGCAQGYLCRLLADRGATVVGVEPAASLFDYAVEREIELRQAIRYVQADLAALPDLGAFDAVIASMVLCSIPDWQAAMKACVDSLLPGGLFIVTLNHPCFEGLAGSWAEPAHRHLPLASHEGMLRASALCAGSGSSTSKPSRPVVDGRALVDDPPPPMMA